MQSKCQNCQKEFTRKPSHIGRFCSMPCYRTSRRGVRITVDNGECLTCKKSIHIPNSLKHRKKFCSKKCMGVSQRGKSPMQGKKHSKETRTKLSLSHVKMVGPNSSNWKGGITPQGKAERLRFRRIMQKKVLERDNYTCQLCGKRGVALQVDHIQEWSKYVELRFDISNCRTLCTECHYYITFGKQKPKNIKAWGQNLKYMLRKGVAPN